MSSGQDQNKRALEIVEEFLSDSLPEYIQEEARVLISHGRTRFKIKKDDTHWEIQGQVGGEDLQQYTLEAGIDFTPPRINFFCNCSESFSGLCAHIGAVALALRSALLVDENGEGESEPQISGSNWRQIFGTFFTSYLEPESGKHYIVFRIYPEPHRIQVAFFRARENRSGLSQVHQEITLEQIVQNPEWCEISPDLPAVAEQLGHYLGYYGHRVDIPPGMLSWFFYTIANEYYVFLQDSERPVSIENKILRLHLAPKLSEEGLSLEILLSQKGGQPFTIMNAESYFYGQLPLWIYWNKNFFPVQTGLSPRVIRELSERKPVIPHAEIPDFLDRVWTQLPVSELYGQEEFLEKMRLDFVNAVYNPKLFLDEEGSLLTLRIQNIYETTHGEFYLPGPNPDLQTGSYHYEGKAYLLERDREKENELVNTLFQMDFQSRNMSTWFLELDEAIRFLLDSYPKLVEQYRVFGEKKLTRFKVRLVTPQIVAEVKSKKEDSLFSLDLSVDYGGENVPIDKIWKAWSTGKRYVQLRDGSYASLPESWLSKLGHKLKSMGMCPERPPSKEFRAHETPILDKLLEDLEGVKTDPFWDELRSKITNFKAIHQIPVPPNFLATLRPYQSEGLSYLNFLREYGFGGILADEMGLGKTVQTLAFLQYMVNSGTSGPNLIVVPTSVLPNWEREAAKFTPNLKTLIVYGAKRENLFKQISSSDLIVTTYALLRRDLEELEKFKFNAIILDEAQSIKNANTITSRSVRKLRGNIRLCLSGTPIENNLLELWSLFQFLMPGFLGGQTSFQRDIVKPIRDGDEQTMEYLRRRVKPFILRRTKSEVAKDLPPKIENIYYCNLENEQMELYAALAKKLNEQVLATVDEKGIAKSQMSILDALLKLRQICCHPRLLRLDMPDFNTNLPSGKFDAFKDLILDIVSQGHKVLVFSQFVNMLKIIRSWLQINQLNFAYLDGSSKDRQEQVDNFNSNPDIPIFLISLKAGGIGINLTSADYVIHYDPWWNPAVESQASDRAHRIGQSKQVFSYKLICQNTVEEKILRLQAQKKDVAEAIIPGTPTWKSLTRTDLEMLFEV